MQATNRVGKPDPSRHLRNSWIQHSHRWLLPCTWLRGRRQPRPDVTDYLSLSGMAVAMWMIYTSHWHHYVSIIYVLIIHSTVLCVLFQLLCNMLLHTEYSFPVIVHCMSITYVLSNLIHLLSVVRAIFWSCTRIYMLHIFVYYLLYCFSFVYVLISPSPVCVQSVLVSCTYLSCLWVRYTYIFPFVIIN